MKLLEFDYSRSLIDKTGLSEADIQGLASTLEQARTEVLDTDLQLYKNGKDIPAAKEPLDAGFIEMPARLLEEYRNNRDTSELGRLLQTADRIRESVDRVVVLGIGGSYMGARALMESCCHPYHNELSRGERGGRPRLYFEGNNVDNDALQGLLELVSSGDFKSVDQRWGIVAISKSGGTLETAVALRVFLAKLREQAGDDKLASSLVVPVTGPNSKLFNLSTALGCKEIYEVPEGVGGRFSVLSPVGLLPAAILGIDIIKLLEGAVAMTEHFRSSPLGSNTVLDYVAVCHAMDSLKNANLRLLSVWSKTLESVGLWYDQLMAESLGKNEIGATPLTVVNTRDLHSRAQQHQEGARDKFITNVIVRKWRRDDVKVGKSDLDQDGLNAMADLAVPRIMTAAIDGTNAAYAADGRPTADLFLPEVNEATLGQLLQMFMLATVVEGRVMGINPYGQPGVEVYKKFMKQNLS